MQGRVTVKKKSCKREGKKKNCTEEAYTLYSPAEGHFGSQFILQLLINLNSWSRFSPQSGKRRDIFLFQG